MAPAASDFPHHPEDEDVRSDPLIEVVSGEIELMRKRNQETKFHSFPPACAALLKNLQGNHRCVDCGDIDPQWAAVRYGGLLCLQCSGVHRSLGVQVSTVRSISMDAEWSLEEVVSMLEGGNAQLLGFFERHALCEGNLPANSRTSPASRGNNANCTNLTPQNVTRLRYKTKAALFYRKQMEKHVQSTLEAGPYQGREVSRRRSSSSPTKRKTNSTATSSSPPQQRPTDE